MNWKIPVLVAGMLYSALSAASLFAQDAQETRREQESQQAQDDKTEAQETKPETRQRDNNHAVVIGTGFGGHQFATTHKAGQEPVALEVISAFMQQYYAEWYVFDTLGLGFRFTTFGTSVSSSTSVTIGGTTTTASSEADLKVNNWLFTVNWVPLGGKRYARLGVLAGLGMSDYTFTETNIPGGVETSSTSGPAALLGIYVDWGADGFGARFGTQYLATDLDPVDGSDVDASGRDVYIDLRWAF